MTDKRDRAKPVAEERITPSWRPRQVEKTAPCQTGCANCGDIRGWIAAVAQRHKSGVRKEEAYANAWRLIVDVNPFPATLGRICPHPCEKHCNRSELDEPLAINAMERFLGDYAIDKGLPLPREAGEKRPESIGVVGAGPSGLSFAYQMARRGYRVAVYDARDRAGGMLRYGVPSYRLPEAILDAEIGKITGLGVDLRLRTRVGRDVSLAELRGRHDCLYLGIGAQRGRDLKLPGAEGPGVWRGTDYLERVNTGHAVDLGTRVAVIGGGNTAIDAARCARRGGARVTVLYRRSREEMPAIDQEIEEALEEGIELMLLVAPVRLERDAKGHLKGIQVRRMRLGEPDGSGRCRPLPIAGSEFQIRADAVIAAIAQVPVLDGLDDLTADHGWLVADTFGAVDDQIWAGGDAVGAGIAGEAIIQGRHAAERLHARLRGEAYVPLQQEAGRPEVSAEEVRFASRPMSEAVRTPTEPGATRVARGMEDSSRTISEEEFLAEVDRCFSCGSCLGCEQCFMYCTAGCFTRVEEAGPGMYFTVNLDSCEECGKCIEVCPCGFLEAI